MSRRNGDKARFGIARKRKMLQRQRTSELRKTLQPAAVSAVTPAAPLPIPEEKPAVA